MMLFTLEGKIYHNQKHLLKKKRQLVCFRACYDFLLFMTFKVEAET